MIYIIFLFLYKNYGVEYKTYLFWSISIGFTVDDIRFKRLAFLNLQKSINFRTKKGSRPFFTPIGVK